MIPKQTEYKVGMYLRLSNEDERAGESLSIENQRKILTNYISEQGWTLYDEYVDDGISGTTFDRPGVQRMLDDAKNGRINLILCKDLSRFGRNYIQVGQYTEYSLTLNIICSSGGRQSLSVRFIQIITLSSSIIMRFTKASIIFFRLLL